jgi:Tol biopolymer transport system component/DNA-binding winged helix-turn-helix (wHTH) protein
MTGANSFVFRFADVEVREREFAVVRSGSTIPIEPKAFRVLVYLLRNPQRVVTKEELLNAVWADAAVTENSLTRSILKLRRALDDDARDPRFIETVSTVGYRFLSSVTFGEAETVAAPSPLPDEVPPAQPTIFEPEVASSAHPPKRRRFRLLALLAAACVCALAAGLWYFFRSFPAPRVVSYRQITHDDRRKGLFGIDAARLYFNYYPSGDPIAQAPISGGVIVPIHLNFNDPWLFDVSHDGSSFLIKNNDGDPASLWIVEALGGARRQIASGPINTAAFSPDARHAAFTLANGDIDTVNIDGSGLRKLATVEDHSLNTLVARISWSPDGRTLRLDSNDRILEIRADGSGLRYLLPQWRPSAVMCCGQWTPDGRRFFFLAWDSPSHSIPQFQPSQIWALEERSGIFRMPAPQPVQLTSGPIRWGRPMPSLTGNDLFVRGVTLNGELNRFDPASRQFQPYLGGISAESVTFSPDGKSVAYVTFPEGILWRANRDGSNPVRLTDPPFYPMLPQWSPDGSRIAFLDQNSTGHDAIYLVSSAGNESPRPLLPSVSAGTSDPSWSPDGSKIVFTWEETKAGIESVSLRILDVASGKILEVSGPDYLFSPRWSPDGRSIAALTPSHTIAVLSLISRRWTILEKGSVDFPSWSRNSEWIYFLRYGDAQGVYRIRPSGGKSELFISLSGFRMTSANGEWMGLDPDDNPLILRDTGGDDIYALKLSQR